MFFLLSGGISDERLLDRETARLEGSLQLEFMELVRGFGLLTIAGKSVFLTSDCVVCGCGAELLLPIV